jgi:hypothetical protein
MATAYVCAEVDLGNGLILYVDGNSKITAGNGTYDNPAPNAFSLPHIATCPGATDVCLKSCYIFGLQKNAAEVYSKYCHNERMINRILMSKNTSSRAAYLFGQWISNNCPDGFRWHVSGDVMNDRYAFWITDVCRESPNIRHWIYTRSLPLLSILDHVQNLTLNVSADEINYNDVKAAIKETESTARICYLTQDGSLPDDLPDDSVIFPDYNLRGRDMDKPTDHDWWKGLSQRHKRMVCVADFYGQSESYRCGPCTKCLVKKDINK